MSNEVNITIGHRFPPSTVNLTTGDVAITYPSHDKRDRSLDAVAEHVKREIAKAFIAGYRAAIAVADTEDTHVAMLMSDKDTMRRALVEFCGGIADHSVDAS